MADIFISYKREDRDLIEGLAASLEAENLTVWWDTDLPLGKNYAAVISEQLISAKVVMPVWTRLSSASEWVQEEANVGKAKGNLIPVRLEPVEPPIGFRMIQTADLSNWKPGMRSNSEWNKLIRSLNAVVSGSTVPIVPPRSAQPEQKELHLRYIFRPLPLVLVALTALGLGIAYFVVTPQTTISADPPVSSAAEPSPDVKVAEQVTDTPVVDDSAKKLQAGSISYITDQGIAVNYFEFSPDGKTAVSAGNDGTVRILDASTGKQLALYATFGPRVLQAHFSRTGDFLAVSSSDNTIVVIDIKTGAEKWRYKLTGDLLQMVLAPDDGSIAVLFYDSTVSVYQIDGVMLTTFTGRKSPNVYGIGWCPQSDCLLLWGKNGMLEVWDAFKPNLVDTLRGHAGVVRAASFSADGQSFATVADDKQVLLWDANTGTRKGTVSGLIEDPTAVTWSRDSQWFAVETKSGKAFIWSALGSGPKIVDPKYGFGHGWIAFTPDGTGIVTGNSGQGPVSAIIPK
jgi:hypothetical protein